jgi:hypothetical protein
MQARLPEAAKCSHLFYAYLLGSGPDEYGDDVELLLEAVGIVHARASAMSCAARSRDDFHD